jgi:hypothetical protein
MLLFAEKQCVPPSPQCLDASEDKDITKREVVLSCTLVKDKSIIYAAEYFEVMKGRRPLVEVTLNIQY